MQNTLFEIKDPMGIDIPFTTEVEGCGQEAASAILNEYPFHIVILSGFIDAETRVVNKLCWN